jgi:large subunit ribosomal protein L17
MRHAVAGRKFSRSGSARKALLASLARSLFKHEQIKTTLPKAKDLRSVAEKLITTAKAGTIAARRELQAALQDKDLTTKLMSDIAVRSKDRKGGYTRVLKAGFRAGDNAPMAIIALTDKAAAKAASTEEAAKGAKKAKAPAKKDAKAETKAEAPKE